MSRRGSAQPTTHAGVVREAVVEYCQRLMANYTTTGEWQRFDWMGWAMEQLPAEVEQALELLERYHVNDRSDITAPNELALVLHKQLPLKDELKWGFKISYSWELRREYQKGKMRRNGIELPALPRELRLNLEDYIAMPPSKNEAVIEMLREYRRRGLLVRRFRTVMQCLLVDPKPAIQWSVLKRASPTLAAYIATRAEGASGGNSWKAINDLPLAKTLGAVEKRGLYTMLRDFEATFGLLQMYWQATGDRRDSTSPYLVSQWAVHGQTLDEAF